VGYCKGQLKKAHGVTVKVALILVPLVAEIVTELEEVTTAVVIENVAVVEPAGTVTLAGTVATEVRLLESVTTIPPAGAGPVNVTVPVDGLPPCTLLGLRVRDDIVGALTVKVACRVVLR
jgi:hypothetical protein